MVGLDFLLGKNVISHVGIRERKVLISGCWINVGSIGGVATQEPYRNRGLATHLMERAIQRIDEDGGDLMIVSGDRGLYRRLGCVDAGTFHRLEIRKRDLMSLEDASLDVRRVEEREIIDLLKLYQGESSRWNRSLRDFRQAMQRGVAPFWTPAEPFLVKQDEISLAYLAVQTSRQDDREGGAALIASEYAGSRGAVLSAARALLERESYSRIVFFVPAHDFEMLYHARRLGIAVETGTLPGHTFKIVNLRRLVKRMSLCLNERLEGGTSEKLSFKTGSGKFQLRLGKKVFVGDVRQAERIIFGPHSQLLKKEIPKFMRALFPLPFPWPGLDSF